uniref:Uncharacterized protein n=1 Tax=Ditylenchus dipsaci TaxID=166011 RepID=A0A915EQH1_9BILA
MRHLGKQCETFRQYQAKKKPFRKIDSLMVSTVQINSMSGASSFIKPEISVAGQVVFFVLDTAAESEGISANQTILVAKNGLVNLLGLPALDALGFLDKPLRQMGVKSINAVLSSNCKSVVSSLQAKFPDVSLLGLVSALK